MRRWLIWTILVGALLGATVGVAWALPQAQGPAIPHPLEEREACLTCHTEEAEGNLAMPEDHAGRAEATCLACHQVGEDEGSASEATLAPAAEPTTVPSPVPGAGVVTPVPISPDDYQGPDFCAACHIPHIEEWQDSTHALAYNDEIFQTSWEENFKPGYCLKCHATGYDPNTGEPVAAGVTCESCHGVYEEGHPQVMMMVDAAAERCGVCHETTYQEWQLSGHAKRGVKCASCHAVHSQGLLFGTATALCANCHGDRADDFAHASHAEHNVTCADCHMYRPPDGPQREGLNPTGHFFAVESQACTQCHTRDSIHSRRGEFDPDEAIDVHVMERITTLEDQITDLESGVTRNLVVGLLGGGLGGLTVGVLLGWVMQHRNGRKARGGSGGSQAVP